MWQGQLITASPKWLGTQHYFSLLITNQAWWAGCTQLQWPRSNLASWSSAPGRPCLWRWLWTPGSHHAIPETFFCSWWTTGVCPTRARQTEPHPYHGRSGPVSCGPGGRLACLSSSWLIRGHIVIKLQMPPPPAPGRPRASRCSSRGGAPCAWADPSHPRPSPALGWRGWTRRRSGASSFWASLSRWQRRR